MLENLEKHYQRLNIPKLKKDEIDYLGSMICYKRQSIKEPKTKRLLPYGSNGAGGNSFG